MGESRSAQRAKGPFQRHARARQCISSPDPHPRLTTHRLGVAKVACACACACARTRTYDGTAGPVPSPSPNWGHVHVLPVDAGQHNHDSTNSWDLRKEIIPISALASVDLTPRATAGQRKKRAPTVTKTRHGQPTPTGEPIHPFIPIHTSLHSDL